jgi:hypothetical protein
MRATGSCQPVDDAVDRVNAAVGRDDERDPALAGLDHGVG